MSALDAQHYARLGFALVPIPHGSKAPKGEDWPNHTITDPDEARACWSHPLNVGLEHGGSQTAALDVDSPKDAAIALAAVGLDLDKVLTHPTVCIRGKNAVKPVYDVKGLELQYVKVTWPHPTERVNGRPKQYTVFEFRAGHGKQDLLPPSLHPSGITYAWEPHPPHTRADLLPPPPELLNLWQDPTRLALMRQACPWRDVEEPCRPTRPAHKLERSDSVIAAFNARHDLRDMLERYGSTPKGRDRYLPPESSTRLAGAVVYLKDGLEYVVVHNASSPLCQQDALGKTRGITAFGVWLEYEHGGDLTAAVRAAAKELGMAFADKPMSTNQSPWALEKSDCLTRFLTQEEAWVKASPWSTKCR